MATYYVSVHDLLLQVQELEISDDDQSLNHDLSLEQEYTYYTRHMRRVAAHSPPINFQLEQETGHGGKTHPIHSRPARTKDLCRKR